MTPVRPAGRVAAAALALLGAALAAGCEGGDAGAGDRPAPGAAAAGDSQAPAPADTVAAPGAWVATMDGVGPARVGMTVDELGAALGAGLALSEMIEGCAHAELPGAPGRVLAMIVDGRVARVEVQDSAVPTDRGARAGDTEARIDSLYEGRVRVEPHKYTDGHYLVVLPAPPADTSRRIVFETDGHRVLEYRVGALPAVAWVEGCL